MLPRLISLVLAALLALAVPAAAHEPAQPAPPAASLPATAVEPKALTPVANVPVGPASSLELVTLAGRDYALTGTLGRGLHVVDVQDPTSPQTRAVYDCPATPGDVEVFHQRGRVLATYTASAPLGEDLTRQCGREANALGADLDGSERGTFLLDLTDPSRPTTVAFLETEHGASEQAVHPSGDYLYGSAPGEGTGAVTVHDISDPGQPRRLPDLVLSGKAAHVSFDRLGVRAYVAAGSSVLVLDTSDPEVPRVVTTLADPRVSSAHQADVISFIVGGFEREVQTFLVVADAPDGGEACLGGLHFYLLEGDAVDPSSYVGRWTPSQTGSRRPCAPHQFRVYEDQMVLTVAWHGVGVLLLDLTNLSGPGAPGASRTGAIVERGRYAFPDTDTDAHAFGIARVEGYGAPPFFTFAADAVRGLDVLRYHDESYGVGPLRPEDLAAPGCEGVPETVRLHDRNAARPVHRSSIDCLSARAISEGIADLEPRTRLYSPTDQVTREQMASFLVRTLRAAGIDSELPDPEPDAFSDTGSSGHREAIAVLAAADIVYGHGDGTYRPLEPVTRGQMASYLVRAAQFGLGRPLAETGSRRFSDVPDGSPHDVAIAVGDDNGLFAGTSATTFLPGVLILRDQMATFLVRLLTVLGR